MGFYRKSLGWGGAALAGILISVVLYLAYVYIPPEDRAYQSPFLKTIPSEFVETDDFRIHYTHEGEGEPLILIHGACAWMYGFRHNIPVLAETYSVYALDMPGNGYTVPLCKDPNYDLDTMSKAISGFMDKLHIKQAILVGHSSGGGWALFFASTHPERVSKLVLIDSNGFDIPEKLTFKLFYVPIIGELFTKFFTIDDVRKGYEDSFYDTSLVTDTMIQETMTPLTFTYNREAQYLSIRNQDWRLTENAIAKINIPTLVIWGKNDQYLDYKLAYRFQNTLPNAKVAIINNCGHSSHEERPDKVNQLILEYLKSSEDQE